MKKMVVGLLPVLYDDEIKRKAMKAVSNIPGVNSVTMDMKDQKFTVIGDMDPVSVVKNLKKVSKADIISVGPVKEEEAKIEEAKKPEEKKDEVAQLVKLSKELREVVFKLNSCSDRDKRKVMNVASGIPGVARVSVVMEDMKLTVVGDMDPQTLGIKLRKLYCVDMISCREIKEEEPEKDEVLESRKKVVFKLELNDDGAKEKIMQAVSKFQGIDSIAMDMKDKKLTLMGGFNLVLAVQNLRKFCPTEIISVRAAKKPTEIISIGAAKKQKEKKDEPKKTKGKEVLERRKKAVFKLNIDDRAKNKIMQAVSNILGIDSIAMDMKDKKLTVMGDFDPVDAVHILRKFCFTEIISVGAAEKQKEKKDEPKKREEKEVPEHVKAYIAFNPHMRMIKSAQEERRGGS